MTNRDLAQLDTLEILKRLRSQIDMAIQAFECGALKPFKGNHNGQPGFEDGFIAVVGDFEIRARFVEHPLTISAAAAANQVAMMQHDIEAYRGALGYSVPSDHDGKLCDGTTPKCGLCDARTKEGYPHS